MDVDARPLSKPVAQTEFGQRGEGPTTCFGRAFALVQPPGRAHWNTNAVTTNFDCGVFTRCGCSTRSPHFSLLQMQQQILAVCCRGHDVSWRCCGSRAWEQDLFYRARQELEWEAEQGKVAMHKGVTASSCLEDSKGWLCHGTTWQMLAVHDKESTQSAAKSIAPGSRSDIVSLQVVHTLQCR